jgi:hypothetical protein
MAKQSSGDPDPIGGGGEPMIEAVDDIAVSEEVIWKAKAEEAEEKAARLEARVQELELEIASAHEMTKSIERRGEIDRELTAARAIDLETARLLTEATIQEMDEPDVSIAVRDLCDRKPFLFVGRTRNGGHGDGAHRAGVPGSVGMGPVETRQIDDEIDSMAKRARSSGDRSELLRYLRVRRGG